MKGTEEHPWTQEDIDAEMVDGLDDGDIKIPTMFKAWFVFVAFVALLMLTGTVYVTYLLLVHFGVIA